MGLDSEGIGFREGIWKGTYMNSFNTLKTFQRKFGDAPVPRMSSTANAGCPANRIAHDTCKKNERTQLQLRPGRRNYMFRKSLQKEYNTLSTKINKIHNREMELCYLSANGADCSVEMLKLMVIRQDYQKQASAIMRKLNKPSLIKLGFGKVVRK